MAAPSGTVWGSIVGGYGRIGIYSAVSSTSTTTTVTVEVWFWSKYSVSDSNNAYYYDNLSSAGSATTSRGSVSISTTVDSGDGWSTSNQQKIGSYSYTYSRGTSEVTRYLRAKLTNIDRVGAAMTASSYFTIPKLSSYTVSYNANGGSGAPSSQTKWYGKNITLSSTKPTRTGYTFQGWAKTSSGSVVYTPGSSYTENASVTLYAVWKAITYTVKYNANGGTGAPSDQTKTYGVSLTLSSTKPTRTNYIFKGWGTSASATTASYLSGSSYTKNAAITLYAVWELGYVKPRIVNLSVVRCDSSGVASDEGQNGLITFDWECDQEISSIVIKWKLPSETSWTSDTVTVTGTSGTVSHVIGSDTLNVESSYDIHITVADNGGSSYVIDTLTSMKFTIDFLSGGNGVAFGKTAEMENTAEFGFDAKFNNPVYGKALGMDRLPGVPSDSDLNDYMEPGCYAVHSNAIASTCENMPIDRAGRLEVWSATGEGIRSEQWSYLRQRYIPYNSQNAVWEREITRSSDNVWKYYDWWRTSLTPTASDFVYHTPKNLWGDDLTSGMYMTAGHTITLKEAVSAQRHGIVLVFCAYNGTEDTNYSWQSFFVPKQLVALSTSGHMFVLGRGNFTYTGTKYLYINDTTISGHADNNLTGSNNGITYANNKFVLRYVIGV